MFERIAYSLRLQQLQRRQQNCARRHDRALKLLREGKTFPQIVQASSQIREIKEQASNDDREYEQMIDELHSRHLIRLVRKYRLQYPEHSEWEEEPPFYIRHLSRAAAMRVQVAIRNEQKERWEIWLRWVPIISMITGLLGTLIGVLAAIPK